MSWAALDTEFTAWHAAGLTLPFWWRDDDAVAETDALHQLNALSIDVNIPVHIAVIPANLTESLAPYVAQNRQLIPIAHGYAHENHADVGAKKCEFPSGRSVLDVRVEILRGVQTLKDAFGTGFHPVFVPPWNRFDPHFLPTLQDIGFNGFSTFTPRRTKWAAKGIEQVNTHVDPIDWHDTRSLADETAILDHTVRSLQDRRLGKADNAEPFGFLTHHLVHDAAIWAFSRKFLNTFADGPTRPWTAAELA